MGNLPSIEAVPDTSATYQDARDVARLERRKLVDEQHAFEEFRRAVENCSPTTEGAGEFEWAALDASTDLDRIRHAYRSTVMSVPHYVEDYDDPFRRSVARELNGDVATALTTAKRLQPHLQTTLLDLTEEAVNRRRTLVQTIDEELEHLDRCHARLDAIVTEFSALLEQPIDDLHYGSLQRTRERLLDLLEDCESLVADRQTQLREHAAGGSVDVEDFATYLYSDAADVHPVLSDLVAVTTIVDRTVRIIERRLSNCS